MVGVIVGGVTAGWGTDKQTKTCTGARTGNTMSTESFWERYRLAQRRRALMRDPQPSKEPCSHPFVHTVYGSADPKRNGTTCVICGEKPVRKSWRRSAS